MMQKNIFSILVISKCCYIILGFHNQMLLAQRYISCMVLTSVLTGFQSVVYLLSGDLSVFEKLFGITRLPPQLVFIYNLQKKKKCRQTDDILLTLSQTSCSCLTPCKLAISSCFYACKGFAPPKKTQIHNTSQIMTFNLMICDMITVRKYSANTKKCHRYSQCNKLQEYATNLPT